MKNNQFNNLAAMFVQSRREFGERPAFFTKKNASFRPISYQKLGQMAEDLAAALSGICGLLPRQHVGILADNCLEWMVSDMAVIMSGAADVPRGSDITDGEIAYILPHSDQKITFVENWILLDRLLNLPQAIGGIATFVVIHDIGKRPKQERLLESGKQIYLFNDLLEMGKSWRAQHGDFLLQERMEGIKGEDLFTIVYTSGTTGEPKGVMLSHANMVSQVKNLPIKLGSSERIVSILPIWHIFERVFEMMAIKSGCSTYYSSIKSLGEDLKMVKPTFMASAPRLWESIYQKINSGIQKASPARRILFKAAYATMAAYKHNVRVVGKRLPILEKPQPLKNLASEAMSLLAIGVLFLPALVADRLVIRKIRQATGGALRGSVSGSAALPWHIELFFSNCGINVLEGYGMTESCPVISVRTFDDMILGTVGPLYPHTLLRLLDPTSQRIIFDSEKPKSGLGIKGEIHVKGPQVMSGYYKNPEATQRVLCDGWLNTGDLGVMTWNGSLKIVGRSKETIVLFNGENVEPVPIENKLLESQYIHQVMLVGQDKKFLGALIVPSVEAFGKKAEEYSDLTDDPAVHRKILSEIRKLISQENGFKSFERVNDFRILPKELEYGEEINRSFKVVRHVVAEKYSSLISSIYAGSDL